jgi:hypothetical protein
VAQTSPVLFDEPTDAAYYLAHDLLLVRAPIDGARVRSGPARLVEADSDDSELAARYAAIKVALLVAMFGSGEAWRSTIEGARARADELAAAAGLARPPCLQDAQIRNVNLEGHS